MQTARLDLVRLTKDHLPGFHAVWSDPIATQWSPHGACKTLKDSEDWLAGYLLENNPLGENYAVILRSGLDTKTSKQTSQEPQVNETGVDENHSNDSYLPPGFFLGVVGTWRSDPVPEIGFIYNRAAWGQGFATEALTAFLELFWDAKPQFNVVQGYCDTENLASSRVLAKSGFQMVETLIGDYSLPLRNPSLRSSFKFEAKRPSK
ncbi:hypothetical protein N7468_005772 [Penicillium chermesinum]|uniref:N-acetyltransferase domain-containing protein n=1 Tax=Penicillium chermesinum TaxID=63820 RepID=A0A9W9NZU3_9EURO|nr:uncharacterized protein N7468_005772 [Penicillium chermesinum]KAJ5232816.1 hypothetical protein N7468_005772 [Penicillium chermesinum]KAJ6172471.1 hypothetical protein N7470_001538 [Penicillium chermesinum]